SHIIVDMIRPTLDFHVPKPRHMLIRRIVHAMRKSSAAGTASVVTIVAPPDPYLVLGVVKPNSTRLATRAPPLPDKFSKRWNAARQQPPGSCPPRPLRRRSACCPSYGADRWRTRYSGSARSV